MSKGFEFAGIIWWMIIPGAFVFSFLMAHQPELIPFEKMGGLGEFLHDCSTDFSILLKLSFWGLVIAHAFEAILARQMCQTLRMTSTSTCLWMIQTFILGYPSLKILRAFIRQRQ